MSPAFTAIAAALALGWLWFLARGRARGALKRAMLRLTLLVLVFALVEGGRRRGIFLRSSPGFLVALLAAVLAVSVGYLYLTRFCGACGRMVRNLRVPACPRCGAPLPRHGMTSRVPAHRKPLLGLRPPEAGPRP